MTPTEITKTIKDVFEPLVDPSGDSPDKTPGLVVGFVTESGSGVVGLGTTRVGNGVTPDGATFFGIGSVSKIFTGFMLAKAVLDGNIELDESINTYLRDDLNVDPSITPSQLVSHTSGLPDLPDNLFHFRDLDRDGRNDSVPSNPAQHYGREQLAECLKSEHGAGSGRRARVKYSNLGFGILGTALADKLGFTSFDSMIKACIATPLSMANTGVRSPSFRTRVSSAPATGYDFVDGRLRPVPFPDMGALAPAGGLISTADDMLRLLRGLTGIRTTPLQKVFVQAMTPLHAEGDAEIAYGIRIVRSKSGARIYGKGGETSGYTSLILWMTTPKIGFILLANRGHFERLNAAGLKLIGTATSEYPEDAVEPVTNFRGGIGETHASSLANERVYGMRTGREALRGSRLHRKGLGKQGAAATQSSGDRADIANAQVGVRPSRKEAVIGSLGGLPKTPRQQRRRKIAERLRGLDQNPGGQTQCRQVPERAQRVIVPIDTNGAKVVDRSALDGLSNNASAAGLSAGQLVSPNSCGAADAKSRQLRRKGLAERLRAFEAAANGGMEQPRAAPNKEKRQMPATTKSTSGQTNDQERCDRIVKSLPDPDATDENC